MGRDGDGDSHGAWEILTPLFRLCSGRAPRIQLASTRSTLRLRGGSASAGLGGAPLLVTNPTFCPTLLPLLSLSLHFSFPPLHLSSMQSMHERLRAALACLDMLCTAGACSMLIESGYLLCQRSCVCCNHQACAHALHTSPRFQSNAQPECHIGCDANWIHISVLRCRSSRCTVYSAPTLTLPWMSLS